MPWSRREASAVVAYGNVGVLEVDGPPWHQPERADEHHERDRRLREHRIMVERYSANRCREMPDDVVAEPPLRTRLDDRHKQQAVLRLGRDLRRRRRRRRNDRPARSSGRDRRVKGDSYRLRDRDLARPPRDD
jgi:hypothetical protein